MSFSVRLIFGLLLMGGMCWNTNQAHGQRCPGQLLYTFANFYYYSVVDCANGQGTSDIYVYNKLVQTGCGQGACATTEQPYTVLYQPRTVGDPPGANRDGFKKVDPNSGIMVEFGQSPVSLFGGYPKFVRVNDQDRELFFKIYHVSFSDGTGNPTQLRMGAEVTKVPDGKSTIDAAEFEFINKRMVLSIKSPYGQVEKFECLYEIPEAQE